MTTKKADKTGTANREVTICYSCYDSILKSDAILKNGLTFCRYCKPVSWCERVNGQSCPSCGRKDCTIGNSVTGHGMPDGC